MSLSFDQKCSSSQPNDQYHVKQDEPFNKSQQKGQQEQHQNQHQQQQQQQQSRLKLNPRANVFILVNLGCEMLYVIDQRLRAQQIAMDKSVQVVHDITAVLLEPKFIDSLIVGSTQNNSQLLTADHCKFMLNDIATCSLMRLDENSMSKLWNLMTMVYKWQLFIARHQHHLLEITFRHLDSIGKLYPDEKRCMLIDFTKNTLLDFWNSLNDDEQFAIYRTNKAWLECFNTKISLLIRLGFQTLDGTLLRDLDYIYYKAFVESIGENIYSKSVEISAKECEILTDNQTKRFDQLTELLNFSSNEITNYEKSDERVTEDCDNCTVEDFQKQLQEHLEACNISFDDNVVDNTNVKNNVQENIPTPLCLDMSLFPDSSTSPNIANDNFVQLKPAYNKNINQALAAESSPSSSNNAFNNVNTLLDKDLLDLYSKLE